MNTTQPTKQVITIIAMAMHVSILIFFGLVYLLASQAPVERPWISSFAVPHGNEIVVMVFTGMAAVLGGLSLFFPVIAAKSQKPVISDLPANDDKPKTVLFFDFDKIDQNMLTLTIVRFALAESIAIFGLVLSFLSQSTAWVMPFAFVALSIQILVGPFGGKLMR